MPNVPNGAKDKVMHVEFPITEAVHLMGSDVVEGLSPPVIFGNNFHVSVVANNKAEAGRAFTALSELGPSAHAARGRSVGAILPLVRPPLRHQLNGEPPDAGLT
jgi:uncharacterized glyoxalase superfamily protein PhnB